MLFTASAVLAQTNSKMQDDAPYQKTLTFEEGIPLNAAISAFTKANAIGRGYTFEAKKASTDKTEMTHQRHQQFYKGIKVEFGMLITHSLNGMVTSVNGEIYNANELNLIPTLTKELAFERALIDTHAQKYLWEDAAQAQLMDYHKPEAELVIFPKVRTGEVRLAYKFDIYAMEPISREEIFVDAHTGEILYKNPLIKHANRLISDKESKQYAAKIEAMATGNAVTRYSGSKNIEATFNVSTSKYNLFEPTRGAGNGVVTYNCEKLTTYQNKHFEDADNNWTAAEFANANKDNAALDAHWGAEKTYDFWKNVFNRNSYDDEGALIKSYVHFRQVATSDLNNAFWNGSVMTYGDGTTNPLTTIDICGHEIGHAICSHTANLAYQNQSGGMNEGYSDIWGACIEHYGRTGAMTGIPVANVWKIGEDLSATGMRSLADPNSKSNPDCVKGTYWTTTADDGACTPASGNDYCGVHNNSGVMNHWFYILTVGESGTNNAPTTPLPSQRDTYAVTGIGLAKAAEIAYLAERDYLTSNSTYADARVACLAVAGSLYCASSPEYKAVMDSWFAVNVGTSYTSYSNDVNLKSVSKNIAVACNTSFSPSIVFENSGTNPITSVNISYTIDGGAPTTTSWTGSLTPCSTQTVPLTIGALARGTHILTVTTTVTSDGNATNNTKTSLVIVNTAGTVGTINTFDSASDVLVSVDEAGTNNLWKRGLSAKVQLSSTVAGNSPVYATKLTELYPDRTKAFLVSQCYNLSNVVSPVVKFNMAYDFETDWDLMYMEYSTDGTTWNPLGTGTSATWYTSARLPDGTDCFNCIGGQWTGEGALSNPRGDGINAMMREYSYSLAEFGNGGATPQSNMLFRFVFHSDDAQTEEGAIIDNFVIDGTLLGTAHNDFNTFSLYPNPTKGTVMLSLSATTDVNVSLFDISGRNIYNKSFSNSDMTFTQELKFNGLSKGVYILNVESDGKKASKKLIIE